MPDSYVLLKCVAEAVLSAPDGLADSGPPGGPAEYRYEYLLVVARKR